MTTEIKKSQGKKTRKNDIKRYIDPKTGLFLEGNPGGGRHKETQEQKLVKKETKKFLEKYKEEVLVNLPELSPVLIKQAKKGDMKAFDQIHKVIGAYENEGGGDNNVQVNILIQKANEILE